MNRAIQSHEQFMARALELAKRAAAEGETPVGAVIVRAGHIVGTGYNRVENQKDPTAHAEILAIREAACTLADWRLSGCTAYVTLEPCFMCAAAMVHARIDRLVFGARDIRWGGVGSLFDLSHDPRMNHQIEVIAGIMEKEAAEMLQQFFGGLRTQQG